MNGHYVVVAVGGDAGGTYAAWRLLTGAVGAGSPFPPQPSDRRIARERHEVGGRKSPVGPPPRHNFRARPGVEPGVSERRRQGWASV